MTAYERGGNGIARWKANTSYAVDSVVINDKGIYIADALVPSRSIFTATDWTLLSGGTTTGGGTTPGSPAPGQHFPAVSGTFAATTSSGPSTTVELSRVRFTALQDINSPVPVYGNFGYTDTDNPNNITIESAVEYPNGTFTRITFTASNTKLLTPGSFVTGDDNSLFIPSGANFWVRTLTTVAGGDVYKAPVGTVDVPNGDSVERDGSVTHSVVSGTMTPVYGQNVNAPLCVLNSGTYLKSCAQIGDSITEGLGVGVGNSFIAKVCQNAGIGYMMLGTPSEQIVGAALDYNRRRTLAAMCSTAVHAYGTNDFKNGNTLASVQAATISLWRYVETSMPSTHRMFQCTVVPFTTSTDAWITTGNQTLGTGNTARTAFNDWVRDGAPIDLSDNPLATGTAAGAGVLRMGATGHPIFTYFDTADKVESARNSGLWKVGAGPTAYTSDGIHPTTAGHTAMSSAIDPTLFV